MADQLDRNRAVLDLFQTSQCSWCKKFYTNEPFLCTSGKLQSNCEWFDELNETGAWEWRDDKREKYLLRIVDMIRIVQSQGTMARCRNPECRALNPNPNPFKSACWKCGKTLSCPQHPYLTLTYNMDENLWRCPLASHSQTFYEVIESKLSDLPCPKCSLDVTDERPKLYYDGQLLLLKCNRCNRSFTYDKDKLIEVKMMGLPQDYISISEKNATQPALINPMLLSVKMFLADVNIWLRQYKEGVFVCSNFSQEVVNRATERGMRCGYVAISFENSYVGHAIVAFVTDYGLVFIEPQNGEQVDVHVGRNYNAGAKGFQESNIIHSVIIKWNDGTTTRI